MNPRTRSRKVFVALPSVALAKPKKGHAKLIVPTFKTLVSRLRESGFEVFCPYDDCDWDPTKFDLPEDAIKRDWERVNWCDHFVAYPCFNNSISGGVHVEIGWATALGKPCTILAEGPVFTHSVMLQGLSTIYDAQLFQFEKDVLEVFSELVERILNCQKRVANSKVIPFDQILRRKNR